MRGWCVVAVPIYSTRLLPFGIQEEINVAELKNANLSGDYTFTDADWDALYSQSKCKKLTLGPLNLSEMPPGLNKMKQLVLLDISENSFTAIPAEAFELGELKEFFMYKNKITAFPKEMARLTKLEDLNMFDNAIKTIADEINDCVSLTSINLGEGKFMQLPAIDKLVNLTNLQLQWGKLFRIHVRLLRTVVLGLYLCVKVSCSGLGCVCGCVVSLSDSFS